MQKNVAVVIPSYKESLTANENISLIQAKKIFKNYNIFFILPNSAIIDYGCMEISEYRYSNDYFSSLRMYSKFMLQPDLYQDFREYDYILVYQLDAFVFEDRINEFCDLGYDYIGAPWLDGVFFKKNEKETMWYVGNGGLSLRKVDSFLKWTKKADFSPYIDCLNEDLIIAAYGFPLLNIAPIDIALSFSFEANYTKCMELTKGRIPFGCHAWERYQFFLWKPLIEEQGYIVETPDEKILKFIDLTAEMNDFCNRYYEKDELEKILPSSYTNSTEGIYIWGAGLWGISLMHKLIEKRIPIAGFIDNDNRQWDNTILSYKILNPALLKNQKKAVIVAIKKGVSQVETQLQKYRYREEFDYTILQKMFKKQ